MQTLQSGFLLHNTYLVKDLMAQSDTEIFYIAADTESGDTVVLRELYVGRICGRKADGRVMPQPKYGGKFADLRETYAGEARFFKRFSHPNILGLRRIFKANGTVYLVSGFVRGQSLGDMLSVRGKLAPDEALPLIGQVADALHDLHLHGRQYLDIRPENILITSKGKAVLLAPDFVRQQAAERFDQSAYIPIEVHIAKHTGREEVQPTADVYGLAALLYHCLVGHPPLSSIERQNAKLAAFVLPGCLREAIVKALAMPAQDRYGNIPAFIAALHKKLGTACATAELPSLPAGSRLGGRYEVGRVVFAGETGMMYEATEVDHDRRLWLFELFLSNACVRGAHGRVIPHGMAPAAWEAAVSLLSGHFGGARYCKMLRVVDCLEQNDGFYLIANVERAMGVKQHVRKHGPMPVRNALRLVKMVSRCALNWQRNRIVSIGFSLENILLDPNGEPMYWLPAFCSAVMHRHLPDGVLEKPAYGGQFAGEVSEWMVVRQLSALLYYCLTASEVVLDERFQPKSGVIPPIIINPAISPKLSDYILHCLGGGNAPATLTDFLDGLEAGMIGGLKGRLRGIVGKLMPKPHTKPH